jgi:hypothetical protein
MEIQPVYEKLYFVVIKVYFGKNQNSSIKKVIRWDNLPFFVRSKWDWYFEYRKALEIVANPRSCIQMFSGSEPIPMSEEEIKKRKVTTIKAKLTKYNNLFNETCNVIDTDHRMRDMFGYTEFGNKMVEKRSQLILKINQTKQELAECE